MFLISLCTVLIVLILTFAAKNQYAVDSPLCTTEEWKYKINKKAYIAFALVLIITSSVRYGFIDTYAYKEMYLNSRGNLDYVYSLPWGVESSWLYFCYLLNFLSSNPHTILFVSALIINTVYLRTIKRYSFDPVFSLVIYFCICYIDTNNGIRQFVAACIIIIGFSFFMKRKITGYLVFALCVFLAYQFHESSLVSVVFALLSIGGKPFNVRIVAFATFGIVFLVRPNLINQYLLSWFSDNKYISYLGYEGGMMIWRALVVGLVPMAFSVWYVYKSKKQNISIQYEEGVLINLTVINTVLYFMGLYMEYWARIAMYTFFAPIVLLPKLVYSTIDEKYRKVVKVIAIILYSIFFLYNVYRIQVFHGFDPFYPEI